MPQDVIDMGETGTSMVSGPAVWFEPGQEADVVAALARHGFRCRKNEDLVALASAVGRPADSLLARYERPDP